MKIPKEYVLLFIVGMFGLSYLLDAVVNPLSVSLPTPYHYFQPSLLTQFPFTTASIFIKGLAIFLSPLWLMSFIDRREVGKSGAILILSSLMQLYALQDIVTKAAVIPIEWALSFSLAGVLLLIPGVILFIKGMFFSLKDGVTSAKIEAAIEEAQRELE